MPQRQVNLKNFAANTNDHNFGIEARIDLK